MHTCTRAKGVAESTIMGEIELNTIMRLVTCFGCAHYITHSTHMKGTIIVLLALWTPTNPTGCILAFLIRK